MVYSNKFVMCVIVNGQVQEELANGMVKLPFGTEYSLRFRNKNDRRAVVQFFIDGEPVSGNGYIVPANNHIDIKRHLDKDRAFKFVELNSPEAVDAGKNGDNHDKTKGLIEARFYLEKQVVQRPLPIYRSEKKIIRKWTERRNLRSDSGAVLDFDPLERSSKYGLEGISPASPSAEYSSKELAAYDQKDLRLLSNNVLKDGCTVEGNVTGQSFNYTNIDTEEHFTVLKIYLQGFENTESVVKVSEIERLEAENARLRKELAEIENARLKEELEKSKKKPRRKIIK